MKDHNSKSKTSNQRSIFLFSLALFLFFPFPRVSLAATYYVAKDGNDNNPGTESLPWLTISKAASTAIAGDTVFVKEGTYDEKVRFSNNGREDAYITYKVYENHLVAINYSGTDDHVVLFTKAYIIMGGFKIYSARYQPIRLNPGAHHVIVRNCELAPSGPSGTTFHGLLIESDAVHHCTFERNIIHGHGVNKLHHGMYIKGDYHIIDGNIIYDNAGYGIHMYNSAGSAKHCIVRNNVCFRNGVRADNGGSGILLSQGDNLVYNNICYDNRGGSNSNSFGIFVYEVPVGSGPNKIYNNVLYNNGRAGLGIQGSDNTIVKNNIIMNNDQYNLFMLNSTNTTLDYNCYYPDGASAFFWNRALYDFSRYKLASGQDSNSICQDPKFVDASNYDFHLQPDSPAIDRGTTLTEVPKDKDGIERPQGSAYDIGAYEWHEATSITRLWPLLLCSDGQWGKGGNLWINKGDSYSYT